jgi:hypothetical protein
MSQTSQDFRVTWMVTVRSAIPILVQTVVQKTPTSGAT